MSPELILIFAAIFILIPAMVIYLIRLEKKEKATTKDANDPEEETRKLKADRMQKHIVNIASAFEQPELFKAKASAAALALDFEDAKNLVNYFHNNPPVPEDLKPNLTKYGVFGVWMEVCQNAIFEILYNYKEKALPMLYEIGFGVYDWTQYKAIGILFRLAKEGVQREEIVEALKQFAATTTDTDLKGFIEKDLQDMKGEIAATDITYVIQHHQELRRDYQLINLTQFTVSGQEGHTNDAIANHFIHSLAFKYDSLPDCIKREPKKGYLGHAFDINLLGISDFRKFDKTGLEKYLHEYIDDSDWGDERNVVDFKFLMNQYLEIHRTLNDADFYVLNVEWFAEGDKRVYEMHYWSYSYYFLILYVDRDSNNLMVGEWFYD